ncbi:MAG: acetate--CoA ligase family protein [Candidatus Firestonebacteria bacterium]
MLENADKVFYPKSIAIVGASTKENTLSRTIFTNLIEGGYKGILYPVNPKAESILGVKCYPTITAIPDGVDLAVIVIPSKYIPASLEECGKKGIKGIIIISAGFKEVGGEGVVLEKQVVEISKKYNMALIGPNCLGVINPDPKSSMNAAFGKFMPKAGNIAFITQSGALGTAILDYAKGLNIGFSKFVSMGNKAGLKEMDLLKYLKDDPVTKVIIMYVEDMSNPREFLKVASEINDDVSNMKPIVAMKSGRTAEGAKAASSHTGALAGSDEMYEALFNQCGVIRANTVEELLDVSIAFAHMPVPKGNRVCIVTNAGGPGIMTTDAAIKFGLQLAKLDPATIAELRKKLPPTSNFNNPIDVIGDAQHDRYEWALEHVMKDKNVDCVIVLLTPQSVTDVEEIAMSVVKCTRGTKIPVLACFMGIVDVSKGIDILKENNIPVYRFPEEAAMTMSVMYKYGLNVFTPKTKVIQYQVDKTAALKVIEKAKKEGRKYLPELESLEVFNAYGFPTLKSFLCATPEEAAKRANEIGYPVVMKIVSPDIIHKIDVKGVKVGLESELEVKGAYAEMMQDVKILKPEAKIWGVNIQQCAKRGEEVIVGAKRDDSFGPLIMFGLGGSFVEVMKDVSFSIAPIRLFMAQKMIKSVKTYKILEGVRGKPACDTEAIADCICRLSQLMMECEDIGEVDMNPIIVHAKGKGCKLADARIILK